LLWLLLALGASVVACGGRTEQLTASSLDATAAPDAADGACVPAVEGQACSDGEQPCQPADPCCVGYDWFCNAETHQWAQLRRGCPPPPNCDADGGIADASSDVGAVDAGDDGEPCGVSVMGCSAFPTLPCVDGGHAIGCSAIANSSTLPPSCQFLASERGNTYYCCTCGM
jgi:hypothetical protein